MITSKITISGNGICSESQANFASQVLMNEFVPSKEEKAHFLNFLGKTIFGNLLSIDQAKSVDSFYEMFFRTNDTLLHLGDVPVILETFFHQEYEHADFPKVGRIRVLSRDVPLEDGAKGEDSHIICYKEQGDAKWTITRDPKKAKLIRKNEYVFFVTDAPSG